MNSITLGQAGIYALLGYATVFFGLILLMIVTILVGKFFIALARREKPVELPVAIDLPEPPTAPGSAGQLKLYNVDPKTAAMVMAIVADKMGKPINELRFLSIKEVEQ